MANVKVNVEADVATWSSGIAAGAGLHLPVGAYGSADYRSAMRFPVPAGWGSWTSLDKATITFFISDFNHVAPSSSSIFCSRQNITTPVWTKAEGSQSCESGFSGSNTSQYSDISPVSTDRVTFTSGTTANKAITLDVTAAMRYYWQNGAGTSKPVFVFDNNGAGYTELWSRNKGGSYVAYLSIDYTNQSPPTAPTLVAPAAGAVVSTLTPTFQWVHHDPQNDPQEDAFVRIYDNAGNVLQDYSCSGLGTGDGTLDHLTIPATYMIRGSTFKWSCHTVANGDTGAESAIQTFTIKALPVVTIDSTRRMVFASGAPRLQVNWTVDQPQAQYRVQVASPAFDSGWLPGTATSYVLAGQPVVDNVAQAITVSVQNTDPAPGPLTGTATRSFTPRYGLTVHRRDLTAAPVNWGTPTIVSTVPTGATLQIEYGSSATATAAPSPLAWNASLGAVPKARYVFWRAWFIPSATAGPTLDTITISSDATAAAVDKWGTTKDAPGLVAPWGVATDEYVYGSRSLTVDVAGAGPYRAYSYGIKVRAGRSYILTGLMKSTGNSGAAFQLWDAGGLIATAGGFTMPGAQNMATAALVATTDWYTVDRRDTNRYKTPTWVADSDKTVWVVLVAGGAAGSKAWFDAIKLEESTVATPWSPGAVGATVIDAGGVQVDASKGGVFRVRGSDGAARSVVEAGVSGLKFGGDTELASPSTGLLAVAGLTLARLTDIPAPYVPPSGTAFPGSPVLNQRFFRTDLLADFVWNGSQWIDLVSMTTTPMLMQSGVVNISVAAVTQVTTTVTFARAFSVAPVVVATIGPQGAGGALGWVVQLPNPSVTTTQAQLRVSGTSGTFTLPVQWLAWGPR